MTDQTLTDALAELRTRAKAESLEYIPPPKWVIDTILNATLSGDLIHRETANAMVEAVVEKAGKGVDDLDDDYAFDGEDEYAIPPTREATKAMIRAIATDDHTAALDAMISRAREVKPLTVWYGKMPESNGKSNWTASLHRKGGDVHMDGFCFARSEYPDRVRYEADRVRWIIGELAEKPYILDYDADLHSGYVEPARIHAALSPVEEAKP